MKPGLALLALGVLAAGCPHRGDVKPVPTLTPEQARARLEREGARRERLSAVVKASMDGIEGLFASATLDVAVEAPTRMHISVRSFFDQPLQVFATDGTKMTIFDGSQSDGPRFYQGAVTGSALGALFPVEVWPVDVVGLFLQIAPAAGAEPREIIIDDKAGSYELGVREPSGNVSVIDARLGDDALLRWRRFAPSGDLLFDATYEDIRDLEGIPFAHQVRLLLPTNEREARVRFELREPALNGPELDPGLFALEPPPGYPVLPLP